MDYTLSWYIDFVPAITLNIDNNIDIKIVAASITILNSIWQDSLMMGSH